MAEITLAQAEEHLAAWLKADLAVASNQAYAVAGRSFTRADAQEIRDNIAEWERRVIRLRTGGGGIRVRNVIAVT